MPEVTLLTLLIYIIIGGLLGLILGPLLKRGGFGWLGNICMGCLLYTSPSPRDATLSRMPSSA